jgi:hypothetical protein
MRRRTTLLLVLPLALLLVVGGVAASRPAATASGGAPAADSDRWALVVGVSDYAGRTSSTVAGADDAADFREMLLRNGFRDDRIRVLTERDATAANLRAGLRWLVDHSSPSSFSVFHFSGHVKQLGGDRDRDGEALDEYLWPHDNRFVSDAELATAIRSLRGLAWVDIAGCEAAGFDDGLSAPNRLFTASSEEDEKSYELPEWRNSVFTGLLVDQAFLQGHGDRDGNGKVSIQEGFAHAQEQAPRITSRQRRGPQHPVIAGGDGSPWYLDGPPAPPPAAPAPSDGCTGILCWR